MPAYKIRSCTVADGPALARNNLGAFWESPGYRLVWPNKTLEDVVSNAEKRLARNLLNNREHLRHQVAVDEETGRIVGYARWRLPSALAGEWLDAQTPTVSAEEEERITKSFNDATWDFLHLPMDSYMEKARAKYLADGHESMELDYLAVHPDNKGRGIASMLVGSGITKAEKMNVDVYMIAFEAGFNVYKKFGFKILDSEKQDLARWGGEGQYVSFLMEKKVRK